MGTTYYYTVNDEIIGEHTLGLSRLDYIPDALGSVVATVDQTLTVKSTARFKPYGADLATTGTQPTYGWIGGVGYRRTGRPHSDIYIRARTYATTDAQFVFQVRMEQILKGEHPFGYALNSPTNLTDASGDAPDCQSVSNCLSSHSKRCEAVSKGKDPTATVSLALCLFWQETSLGQQSPPGGMGSCTAACFNELKRRGCSWLGKFSSYASFVNNASACEKAQAAYDFLATVGLSGYGPGPGRPGDYRGPTGDRVKSCADCVNGGAAKECKNNFGPPTPPFNEICSYCFGKVHS